MYKSPMASKVTVKGEAKARESHRTPSKAMNSRSLGSQNNAR